jgi:hypothetical protein
MVTARAARKEQRARPGAAILPPPAGVRCTPHAARLFQISPENVSPQRFVASTRTTEPGDTGA